MTASSALLASGPARDGAVTMRAVCGGTPTAPWPAFGVGANVSRCAAFFYSPRYGETGGVPRRWPCHDNRSFECFERTNECNGFCNK